MNLEEAKVSSPFWKTPNKSKQFLISICLIGIVATACYFLSDFIGYKVVAFVLLVTVSLIAMFADILPVLFSALISALIWDYFFIPPRHTFNIGNTEDRFMLAMYFIIALVNAVLTFKIRQIEKIALQKEEKANTVKLYNTLLNSLSHELKTPIAAIIGASDNLLSKQNKFTEENKHNLVEEISIAGERLNQQVENLLNMSRIETGYIQPKKDWCDISELIYSVVNQLEERLSNHKLIIEINERLPLFKIDFGLIEHVIYNLINNAIIYTDENSTITISADSNTEVEGHFVLSADKIKTSRDHVMHNLILTITDNGPGFPPNEIENVFDKFYRLKNSKTGGTGLGLSIAKGFVEAHHGKISVSNLQEGGAKFTIQIPAETSSLKQTEK